MGKRSTDRRTARRRKQRERWPTNKKAPSVAETDGAIDSTPPYGFNRSPWWANTTATKP